MRLKDITRAWALIVLFGALGWGQTIPFPGPGGSVAGASTPTLIQAPAGNHGTTAFTLGVSATAAHDAIFVLVLSQNELTPTITDNKGGGSSTYTLDASFLYQGEVYIFSVLDCAAGITTITVTPGGTDRVIGFAAEYSNIALASAFDQTAGFNNGVTSSYTSSNTVSPTSIPHELLLGVVGTCTSVAGNFLADAGTSWSSPALQVNDSVTCDALWQQKIVTTTGLYAATGSKGTAALSPAMIATYKAR